MYIYIHICTCMYINIHIHTYTYTYSCIHIHTQIQIYRIYKQTTTITRKITHNIHANETYDIFLISLLKSIQGINMRLSLTKRVNFNSTFIIVSMS